MKLLILPGKNSSENSAWLSAIKQRFLEEGYHSESIDYDHWGIPGKEIDINLEIKKIRHYSDLNDGYTVVAKSIGIILSLIANQISGIKPEAAVFLGSPVNQDQIDDFVELIDSAGFPVLFIQQEHDTLTPFQTLEQILEKSKKENYEIISIDGKDHGYDNFSKIIPLILGWFEQLSK